MAALGWLTNLGFAAGAVILEELFYDVDFILTQQQGATFVITQVSNQDLVLVLVEALDLER